MKSICVFCGSNTGKDPVFRIAAEKLGSYLARENIRLVYGAGNIGLMGAMADAALANGGKVTGVIPGFLKDKEVCHTGLDELMVTETMHERKTYLSEISDGFIAMPGGFGTLDELAEILTWAQLGLHSKPIGLLNVEGYFDPLIHFFDCMTQKGFVTPENREMVLVAEEIEALIAKMKGYEPPDVEKWLNRARV